MAAIITAYFSKLKTYLSDHTLITDLMAKLIITFGVVLIVGGLYLLISNPDNAAQAVTASQTRQSAVSIVNWVPGIPFNIGDLATLGTSTIGLICWITGVDLLLVGLGLWVRHKFARIAAITIFVFAASFQFIQFITLGLLGSPISILQVSIDGVIAYFLFSAFDKATQARACSLDCKGINS